LAATALRRLFGFLTGEGIEDVHAVSEEHLVAFARQLASASLTKWTVSAYLSVVRCFFAFLVRSRRMLTNPAVRLPVRAGPRLPRALGQREVARLIDAVSDKTPKARRDRAMLEVMYGSGLRLSECRRLDLMDLDLSNGLVFVRDGKGKKDRVVPLTARAIEALDVYLRGGRPDQAVDSRETALFLARGQRIAGVTIELVVRQWAKAAGVKRVSPHVLRHSCATHLLQGGADVREIQQLLGHSSISTTAFYTKVAIVDLRRVVDRCHPRKRGRMPSTG
jgi:integrase/recombinase XerD